MNALPDLGLGLGWRPELALFIERRRDLGFVELIPETIESHLPLPQPIENLRRRGVTIVPHGVSLSLGSAEPPCPDRLARLARLAERVQAPLVSEHLAFVRGGGVESGHLLPLPRTREMLELVVANIREAKAALPVPLAIENISSLFEWPNAEMDEATFLAEVIEQADVLLLLDIANVYANCLNRGGDPVAFLEELPLHRIAYVHMAGGVHREGIYHDTHSATTPVGVIELLEELCSRTHVSGVLLERDDHYPTMANLNAELDLIASARQRGTRKRSSVCHVG
jgi:hypothetical protein